MERITLYTLLAVTLWCLYYFMVTQDHFSLVVFISSIAAFRLCVENMNVVLLCSLGVIVLIHRLPLPENLSQEIPLKNEVVYYDPKPVLWLDLNWGDIRDILYNWEKSIPSVE